ncbi:conserved hypothetical protein, partial [Wolbachia endosymbiont of Drosophila ananassae]
MPKAAAMWARVAAEKNWFKNCRYIKQESISSFESFTEKETSEGQENSVLP